MATSDVEPIAGPEAFEERGRAAEMSQAAIVLGVGRAVGGNPRSVPERRAVGLRRLEQMVEPGPMPLGRAMQHVDMDARDHARHRDLPVPPEQMTTLARAVVDDPSPPTAASLVEVNLHNPSPLVRTAAAAAALDTTGPREDVVAELAEGAHARDELTRDIGRIGLGRVDPEHEALRHVVVRAPRTRERDEPSDTAVLSHGTFASRTRWWRPGGTFHEYLDTLRPPLHMHDESYQWTGLYSDAARRAAARRMVPWIADQQLDRPDWFAHSHGATVANLATQQGAHLDRLAMLSWPVRTTEVPDLGRVGRVLDVRVRFDLVILVDRGGQQLPRNVANDPRVSVLVNGWFDHGDTHDPAYWDRHDLPDQL
jgi:hypothetical protein